ncbi:MAG: hypothetical protein HYV07_09390 [Deltaproteobacteria bacterium]|nr:hypothetical protein [Deltaproteobacteria bacterium]
MDPARRLRVAWNLPPAEIARRLRRRIFKSRPGHHLESELERVTASSKHMDAKREIERIELLRRMLRLHGVSHAVLMFEGQTVFELGCGPVLGVGPLAVFLGAQKFYFSEPNIHREVFESALVKSRYLKPMYEELIANYGRRLAFEDWYSRVMRTVEVLPDDARDCVDISLSTSVLEHIPEQRLSEVLRWQRAASRRFAWFSHSVDFGPHGFGGKMQDLYTQPLPRAGVNLLRLSDVRGLLQRAELTIDAELRYKEDEISTEKVHPAWGRYSPADLAARVVVFVGRCHGSGDRQGCA